MFKCRRARSKRRPVSCPLGHVSISSGGINGGGEEVGPGKEGSMKHRALGGGDHQLPPRSRVAKLQRLLFGLAAQLASKYVKGRVF